MKRVDTATAVAQKPAYATGGTPGFFFNGDPVQSLPPTMPGQDWFNMVQEEICHVIAAAGLNLDPANDSQLAQAITALIASSAYTPAAASETVSGILKLATLTQALAGTDATTAMTPAGVAAALLSGGVAVSGGTSDAITATVVTPQTALAHGMGVWTRATAANGATTPTFNLTLGATATGAIGIVGPGGAALALGAIAGAGHWLFLVYDSTLNKWVLTNPATTVVTAAGDPTYADNSAKAASTGWIRGAMAAIATAAGFACSLGSNGYIKFPSWLGGIIIQWLGGSYRSTGGPYPNAFPIAFPTACWRVCAIPTNTSRITTLAVTSLTADQVSLTNPYSSQPEALSCDILAIGK